MGNKKKIGIAESEKPEPDAGLLIVKKSVPRMRTVKTKVRIKEAASNSRFTKDKGTTTWETSGNITKLCVDLMPVLASAKEPVEEEEEKEEGNGWEKEPENSSRNEPSVSKSEELIHNLTSERTTETKQSLSPRFVLPPITKPKAAPERGDCQKTQRCHTPLPPIRLCQQVTTTSPSFTTKGCGGDGPLTGQMSDSRPWMDNPLFSKSRSAEFRLPDISLSSLDALLQTVTQKLGRRRRGGHEGPWRPSDHLLMAEQRLRGTSVRQQGGNLANIGAVTDTPVGGCRAKRQMSLPPLFPASKPTLILLTMTKKSLPTSSTPQ